jgi:hypothetical protein
MDQVCDKPYEGYSIWYGLSGKYGKRFRATVGFIADSRLRDTTDLLELTSCAASAQVQPKTFLSNFFPLQIQESLTLIFEHINRKLKLSRYPIQCALPFAEAI